MVKTTNREHLSPVIAYAKNAYFADLVCIPIGFVHLLDGRSRQALYPPKLFFRYRPVA
jgi:hypothetical protein